jgi:hypothetical protein
MALLMSPIQVRGSPLRRPGVRHGENSTSLNLLSLKWSARRHVNVMRITHGKLFAKFFRAVR